MEKKSYISNGNKLITASMIKEWTNKNSRYVQGLLPEIVQKLIIESTDGMIEKLRIPSGDSIGVSGFDGELTHFENKTNSSFVPLGKIKLEIGTNSNSPWTKIRKDFQKRDNSFPEEQKKETTFILIISRILDQKTKEKFCKENKRNWLDLIVYDALDLENWLEQSQATTVHFYEKMEKKKLNYQSFENAWEVFKKRTNPELSPSFFTAGRKDNIEKLKKWFENQNFNRITIRGSSKEEAYGFVLSVLFDYYKNNSIIIVNDIDTLFEISRYTTNKIFIMNFYVEQIELPNNNRFIILFGNSSSENRQYDITLSLRSFAIISNSMRNDMGISETTIINLNKKCGTNVISIIREIANPNFISETHWRTKQLKDLIPLFFLGQINQDNEKDRNILQNLLGNETVEDYLKKIAIWKKIDDTPIFFYGNFIKINAIEELWNELNGYLTIYDFEKLKKIIKQIFTNDINKDNDLVLFRKTNEYYPKYIYEGLLNALILYAIKNSNKQYEIDQLLKEILTLAKNLNQLKYLSEYFYLLVEISPNEFLNFFEDTLINKKELIINFLTSENKTFFPTNNEYTCLLHALISLTYLEKYKIRSCNLLIELYLLNIEYPLKNSPENNLINCFSFLNTENAFSFEEKIDYLLNIIDKYKENIFELCIKIIMNNFITISSFYLKWRNPDVSEYQLTDQQIWLGTEKIIKKILETLKANQTDIYCKILDYYDVCFTKQTMENLKKYIKLIIKTDEEKKPIYEYLFKKIKQIKQFSEKDKNKYYLDFFEELLTLTTPNDEFMKNLVYFKEFISYDTKTNEEKINLITKLYTSMKKKYVQNELIEKIITSLEDNSLNGYMLSKILSIDEIELSLNLLLSNQKNTILVSLLNNVYHKFDTTKFLDSISRQNLETVVKLFGLYNIVNFNNKILQDKVFKTIYWENRCIFSNATEKELIQLKKFNPLMYLEYLELNIDFKLWIIEEILALLKNITDEQLIKITNHSSYYLKRILYKINDNFYTLDVVTISFKFYQLSGFKKIFKSIKRFLFENPQVFSSLILQNTNNNICFDLWINYSFPNDFEQKIDILKIFASTFYNYESQDEKDKKCLLHNLGQIFARSTKWSSNLFIPICLREIIEKYKNEEIRQGFVIGHFNAIGVRNVDDGTNDSETAKKYEIKAKEIEIKYPETAKILFDIAEDYKRNSNKWKQDYLIGY